MTKISEQGNEFTDLSPETKVPAAQSTTGGVVILGTAAKAALASLSRLSQNNTYTGTNFFQNTVRVQYTNPELRIEETDQTDPAGRFQFRGSGGSLLLEKSTGASWSGTSAIFTIDSDDNLTLAGGLVISGGDVQTQLDGKPDISSGIQDQEFTRWNESAGELEGVPSTSAASADVSDVTNPGATEVIPFTSDLLGAMVPTAVDADTSDSITLADTDGFRPTFDVTGGTAFTVLDESWWMPDGVVVIFEVTITSGSITFEATTPAFNDITDGSLAPYSEAGAIYQFRMEKVGSTFRLDVRRVD